MAHRTPDLLHGLIATAPLWALGLLAVVVGLAAVWAVIQLFESAWKGAKAIINTAKGRAAYEEAFKPQQEDFCRRRTCVLRFSRCFCDLDAQLA